ncbi:polysaccharide deacetylase family protein [Guggenheimella bovis]
MKKTIAILLLVVLLLPSFSFAFTPQIQVTSDRLNVRKSADLKSPVVKTFEKGRLLPLDKKVGRFYCVSGGFIYDYHTVLIKKDRAIYPAVQGLVLRSEPNPKSTVLEKLPRDAKLIIKDYKAPWIQVSVNGKTGYVIRTLVTEQKGTVSAPVKGGKKLIALTFDDGPSAYTSGLIDTLNGLGAKATFFVVGASVPRMEKVLKKMDQGGHEVANHGWNHPLYTKLTNEQIRSQVSRTDQAIKKAIGKTPRVLRTPYGGYNKRVLSVLNKPMIFWSMDAEDWKGKSPATISKYVISHSYDGAIILLHDTKPNTIRAVPTIVKTLQAQGYTFVTVSDLLSLKGKSFTPGKVYTNAR